MGTRVLLPEYFFNLYFFLSTRVLLILKYLYLYLST